jgi:ammonia channel protein AmtB
MVEQIKKFIWIVMVWPQCYAASFRVVHGNANHLAFGTDNHKIHTEINQIILSNYTLTSESPFAATTGLWQGFRRRLFSIATSRYLTGPQACRSRMAAILIYLYAIIYASHRDTCHVTTMAFRINGVACNLSNFKYTLGQGPD